MPPMFYSPNFFLTHNFAASLKDENDKLIFVLAQEQLLTFPTKRSLLLESFAESRKGK